MLIPIRCYSCGKLTGNLWDKYQRLLLENEGRKPEEKKPMSFIWEELGLTRYCCKRMLMTHVELIDKLLIFDTVPRELKPST